MPANDLLEQPTREQVVKALSSVIDPELGIDIVELGLVYRVSVSDSDIQVVMTLTTPACPMGNHLVNEVKQVMLASFGADAPVDFRLVWDPPWEPEMMSDKAKSILGWKA